MLKSAILTTNLITIFTVGLGESLLYAVSLLSFYGRRHRRGTIHAITSAQIGNQIMHLWKVVYCNAEIPR
jgi:hypothetical protein